MGAARTDKMASRGSSLIGGLGNNVGVPGWSRALIGWVRSELHDKKVTRGVLHKGTILL